MSMEDRLLSKPRHLPEIPDEHWDTFNEIRKSHNETWAETFERLHNYQDWVDHLFNLPKEASAISIINASTVTQLLPLWLENTRCNFMGDVVIPDIHDIENSVEQGTPGIVIGAGPSLLDNNHLGTLRESAFYKEHKGVIVSTAHSLKNCLDAGVVPDYMVLVDSSPVLTEFIDHDIVDEHSDHITAIFATDSHPSALERWNGDARFFLPIIPDMTTPNVQAVLAMLFPNVTEMDGMANSGSFSWNVARYIGCNPIALIGMDFAFLPDTPIKDTMYYEHFRSLCSSDKEMISAWYRFHTHSFFGTNCYTDHIYDSFGTGSMAAFKAYKEYFGVNTINCTEGGVIDDPEIDNSYFKDWLAKWE